MLSNSIFSNNAATTAGGIYWSGSNGNISSSNFIDNTAKNDGGSIYCNIICFISNCTFNSKLVNPTSKSNGIYAKNNLTINGGKGIVDIDSASDAYLSGISIVVLNNETYYYPPNTNINLPNKE